MDGQTRCLKVNNNGFFETDGVSLSSVFFLIKRNMRFCIRNLRMFFYFIFALLETLDGGGHR